MLKCTLLLFAMLFSVDSFPHSLINRYQSDAITCAKGCAGRHAPQYAEDKIEQLFENRVCIMEGDEWNAITRCLKLCTSGDFLVQHCALTPQCASDPYFVGPSSNRNNLAESSPDHVCSKIREFGECIKLTCQVTAPATYAGRCNEFYSDIKLLYQRTDLVEQFPDECQTEINNLYDELVRLNSVTLIGSTAAQYALSLSCFIVLFYFS